MSSQFLVYNLDEKPPFDRKAGSRKHERPLAESCDHLRQILSTHLPEIDWSDPMRGILDVDERDLQFSLGDGGDLTCIVLSGSGVFEDTIAELCKVTGWWAMDTSTGRYIDPDDPFGRGIDEIRGLVPPAPPPPPGCPRCKRPLSVKTGRCIYCG